MAFDRGEQARADFSREVGAATEHRTGSVGFAVISAIFLSIFGIGGIVAVAGGWDYIMDQLAAEDLGFDDLALAGSPIFGGLALLGVSWMVYTLTRPGV